MSDDLVFEAEIFRHEEGSWMFVATGPDVEEEIRARGGPPRGFGSVRVEATIGSSTWRTSVFPSATLGFVLPVKKPVRVAEDIDEGALVTVRLRVLES